MKFDVRNRVRYLSGRRQFFRQMGLGLLTTGALVPAMHISRASGAATEHPADCNLDVITSGKVGES